jgi:hypothetical protein
MDLPPSRVFCVDRFVWFSVNPRPRPVDILTAFSSNSAELGGKLVLNLAVSLVQVRVLAIFPLAEVIIYLCQDALASGPDGQGTLDPSQLRLVVRIGVFDEIFSDFILRHRHLSRRLSPGRPAPRLRPGRHRPGPRRRGGGSRFEPR